MKIDPDDMISQAEAARIRGVTHQAIVNLVRRGRLKSINIGGKVFVSRTEVESLKKIREGRPPKRKAGKRSRTKTKSG